MTNDGTTSEVSAKGLRRSASRIPGGERMLKALRGTAVLGLLALVLAACGQDDNASGGGGGGTKAGGLIGIAMPTKSSERWILDGNNMVSEFKKRGFKTDLQFGQDDVQQQVSQIENMITKGAKAVVVAAIDNTALSDVLQRAKDSGVKVIAYDRLIRETPNVDYYATFDNFKVGVLQAQYIVDKLGLEQGKKGPFNIELFGGSPDDNNAGVFFDGSMSVLKKYIDDGTLVVKSGQTDFKQVATLRWDAGRAQDRMENLLSKVYTQDEVDAVLSPYDGLSIGILSALKSVGYGSGDKPLPIVTGQDAEVASVKSILAGEQTETVFKDTRDLAKTAVDMTATALKGGKPQVNDTKTYDNGVKVVPSMLLVPVSVDKSNYKQILIDSGYIKEGAL
jgi:putative multiple sugar transport system substrate-binding protein